jgi:asparagine synthase (glutamine-hydrolysing)
MRRLSIIDLEGGMQPLHSENRRIALVANAEIYNYIELREELQGRGHHFATGSDCEVIVHLYEELGDACVSRLCGMFAFALWDEARERLLLARDRMGEKPLYLARLPGSLLFASEMKALLRSGLVPFQLHPPAINRYFHYLYVPEPETAVRGVEKLAAAHHLAVSVSPWTYEERCYWKLEEAAPLPGKPEDRLMESLSLVAEQVVRSDVPVGVALSGGLDSSLVAALAARRYPGKMHAFTVGYEGSAELDERSGARRFAEHIGLPFHEVEVRDEEMVEDFPALNLQRDDPIADPAGYALLAVMRSARAAGVPVILQGQGADELFWGYPWLREAVGQSKMRAWQQRHPAWAWAAYARFLRLEPPAGIRPWQWRLWLRHGAGLRDSWRRIQTHRRGPQNRLTFMELDPGFQEMQEVGAQLFTPEVQQRLSADDVYGPGLTEMPSPRADVQMTRTICETYLRSNGIAQGDRLSMAASVEMRLPLVDHRLVETVMGLRKHQTDCRLPPKTWLKEASALLLPEWVLARQKRGFTPPVARWEQAVLQRYGDDLLDGYLVNAGLLRPEAMRALIPNRRPAHGSVSLAQKLVILESWCRAMASVCSWGSAQ